MTVQPGAAPAVARRVVALGVTVGVIVGGWYADRRPVVQRPVEFGDRADLPMPALREGSTLGVSWFCPGVPAADAASSGAVVLANPTDDPIDVTVTALASDRATAPATRAISVAGRAQLELVGAELVAAPFVAVQVESRSGALLVEQRAIGRLDDRAAAVQAVTPCATAPSPDWYFADGSTTTEADETLLVYNPFLDDAVVDLLFADDGGARRPPSLQSRPVPARSLLAIKIDDTIQRKELVSVALHARVGRVILGRYQVYATKPRRTLVAGLASPSAGQNWTFADGERVAGEAPGARSTAFAVYNPGPDDATVTVTILPESGSAASALAAGAGEPTASPPTGAVPAADPVASVPDPAAAGTPGPAALADGGVTVAVPAGTSVRVPIDKAPDGRFGSLVTSSAPVVVERQLLRVGNPRVVTTVQFGSRLSSTRWAFATTGSPGWTATIIVTNPTPVAATVTVKALSAAGLTDVPALVDVPVPATGTVRLDLGGAAVGSAAVVIEATVDVVAERLLAPAPDQPGSSSSLGLPAVRG